MKCIYAANEAWEFMLDGKLVRLTNGDIIDIPSIPNEKVKQLFPYEEPVVETPVAAPKAPKKSKKTTKKKGIF